MRIKSDWHIHTHCSCDSACMEFETLVRDARELGIKDFGVTDHYHNRTHEPDIAASRKEYEAVMEKHPELKGHFHFGIEASVVSKWELGEIEKNPFRTHPATGYRVGGPAHAPLTMDLNEEFLQRYQIEYVVTGVHWPMYCATDVDTMVREYHRQYMFAATHPVTTILAHYLWWNEGVIKNGWKMPDVKNPFLDFSVIPEAMRNELKAALLEHGTALEINIDGIICNPKLPDTFKDEYLGWMADLQRGGVTLAIGSDCHFEHLTSIDYDRLDKMFDYYGIDTSAFFCL